MEGMERQLQVGQELQELVLLEQGPWPVVIFNGPICTSVGLYRVSDLEVDEARQLIRTHGYVSAVGHEASAKVLSGILQVEVTMNRVTYIQEVGQKAIALKLNMRPAEGRILTAEEMSQIGFGLQLLERLA